MLVKKDQNLDLDWRNNLMEIKNIIKSKYYI